jgi:hypothetical protein
MGKTIGLKQLAQKKYVLIEGLPPEWQSAIGSIPETFDAIMYGESGNGKTNCAVMLLKALLKALPKAKAEYVSYEEGHGKSVQELMISRHNMLEEVGNRLSITEALPFEKLMARMSKRQSAKIWVIDSVQAANLKYSEFQHQKNKFINPKKKKILLFISWADGIKPQGAAAKAIEYDVDVKMRVDRLIMFPKSRHGGNKPFVIHQELAQKKWGRDYWKKSETERPKKPPKQKQPPTPEEAQQQELSPQKDAK